MRAFPTIKPADEVWAFPTIKLAAGHVSPDACAFPTIKAAGAFPTIKPAAGHVSPDAWAFPTIKLVVSDQEKRICDK